MRIQETPSNTLTGHSETICEAVFLPNNRLVSCSDDEAIKVWDTASGEELFTLKGHTGGVSSLANLPNGWLASGSEDETIKLWDLEERKEVKTLRGHTKTVVSLALIKNGNLVSYSLDDTIKIWNPYLAENNLLMTITGHGNKTWFIPFGVFSNDCFVTCSRDIDGLEETTLRVWNPNDGQLVKSLPTGLKVVLSVLALSNGQTAIGADNGTIKIIDLDDECKTRTKEKAHEEGVTSLLQLPNGNLVSAGIDRESSVFSIKVWEVSDLTLLQHVVTDHSESIYSLSISENGKVLASGSEDDTIKIWPISIIDDNTTIAST